MSSSSTASPSGPVTAPIVKLLRIERYRGVRDLVWRPALGLNVILGGGDSGKTTILDALALLFSPSGAIVIADTDYFGRRIAEGFMIEALISMPQSTGVSRQTKALFPWHWDGSDAVQPPAEDGPGAAFDPVYRLRVRGTADLDLFYETIQPNGAADVYSVALRRSIGMVRLGGDDRNDRDLRLVQGSALDRLLADPTLRSRLGALFADTKVEEELKTEAKANLAQLDATFQERALPSGLGLGLNIGQGQTLNALIALTAQRDGYELPLTSWGAGTRRLAALAIAGAWREDAPLTLVDEIERGLEPYRQRAVVRELMTSGAQVFLTTHSPTAIRAADHAALWHLTPAGALGSLDAQKTRAHQARDPELFLSRHGIIAEGKTEVGFVTALLVDILQINLDDHGLRVSDAVGNDTALDLLEALAEAGLPFAGFVDDEGRSPTRWARLKTALGPSLLQWSNGCLEENVLQHVADNALMEFVRDPAGERTGARRHSILERLRLVRSDAGLTFDTLDDLRDAAGADFRDLIKLSALGQAPAGVTVQADRVKELKASSKLWFKNERGGQELYGKCRALGCLKPLQSELLPFVNAIGAYCGKAPLPNLP